jgi:hypothetical protein
MARAGPANKNPKMIHATIPLKVVFASFSISLLLVFCLYGSPKGKKKARRREMDN